jgi:two-component system, OmpR family, phosphate regulon sensor histidine kinase PhoR
MKRKLMFYMLTTIFFSLIITTALFVLITRFQYIDNLKQELLTNNKLIMNTLSSKDISNEAEFLNKLEKSISRRITYMDNKGNVIYDSIAKPALMENHNTRKEILEARKVGTGSAIRYSETLNKTMIYMASEFNNGFIIRTSIPLEFVSVFQGRFLKYYMFTIAMVIGMALILSSKLTYVVIKPIEELQYITSRYAKGELDKRYNMTSGDEIGELGKTFNNMASMLQGTLKDSLEKQNKLEAILKSMDSGVVAVDRSQRIIMINPYAEKIFGIKKDIIGKNLMDYIRDFEFESVFRDNKDDYKEIKILWPVERILRVKTTAIINESEPIGTVAVVQDITDLKRLENMRSQFVANVSHELKTPLTSIKGFAETLKYVEDDVNKEKFLNIINDEAERLTRLINDILTLSDLETHREEKRASFEVNPVVEDVYNLMKHIADDKHINFGIERNKVRNLVGNKDKFKQMLINLVDNAIKYSDQNARVNIGTRMEKDECIIWVEDTGVGIPKEHIPRLFERFYRVDKARSRARGGTGLGLAIVKHIVLTFNGSIEIESEVGKGSKFIVKIPYNSIM